jgi:U3 small nucleolar RNA-associated protein MPP10
MCFAALQVENNAFEHIRELLESFATVMEDVTPKTRAQTRQAKKRKRSPSPDDEAVKRNGNPMLQSADSLMPTQLQELHLSCMEDEQIWAQLELRGQTITNVVEALFDGAWDDPLKALDEDDEEDDEEDSEGELSIEGMDINMEGDSPEEDEADEGLDLPDEAAAEEDDDTSGDENMPEHITQLANSGDEDEELLLTGLDLDRPSRSRQPRQSRPRNRHPTLDDSFFSIVDFNEEIEAAEARSKGRGRLDEDSDEESVDLFHAVPEGDELADQDGHMEGECTYHRLSDCMGHVYSYFSQPICTATFSLLLRNRDKTRAKAEPHPRRVQLPLETREFASTRRSV